MPASENLGGLEDLRVLSLESRRAEQIAALIRNHGGIPVSAPSMRELPLQENPAAIDFAERLLRGRLHIIIFLTGVGTRYLFGMLEPRYGRAALTEALSQAFTVVRGPKPAAVLRELGVPIALAVPEPNTWRDLLQALDNHPGLSGLAGKHIAVQEYGISNQELLEGLSARGAEVTAVPVYRWALPEDLEPLQSAVRLLTQGGIDVVLVTSATQVHHLFQIADQLQCREKVVEGLRRALIASVGPISSETLQQYGLTADLEPTHPKMGQLVFETAQKAREILRAKRPASSPNAPS